jgi:hypothetical protein
MDDLISRQAAIDALMVRDKELRNINWYDKPYAEGECRGIDEALAIVSNLPSAQPQPVVRCKDCKYWMRENVSDGYCSEMNIGDCDEDFYCGYAVRKDNR